MFIFKRIRELEERVARLEQQNERNQAAPEAEGQLTPEAQWENLMNYTGGNQNG